MVCWKSPRIRLFSLGCFHVYPLEHNRPRGAPQMGQYPLLSRLHNPINRLVRVKFTKSAHSRSQANSALTASTATVGLRGRLLFGISCSIRPITFGANDSACPIMRTTHCLTVRGSYPRAWAVFTKLFPVRWSITAFSWVSTPSG